MPACEVCVVGGSPVGGACPLSGATVSLQATIRETAEQRFGAGAGLHLYPYLETTAFTSRHAFMAHWMAAEAPTTILEIGGYFQPISKFLHGFCPTLLVTVDPILDAASVLLKCGKESETHIVDVPATAKEFFDTKLRTLHNPSGRWDAVVCVGCDVHWGPRQAQLLALPRPTTIYLEFSADYAPSAGEFIPLSGVAGSRILINATIEMHEYTGPRTTFHRRSVYILRLD